MQNRGRNTVYRFAHERTGTVRISDAGGGIKVLLEIKKDLPSLRKAQVIAFLLTTFDTSNTVVHLYLCLDLQYYGSSGDQPCCSVNLKMYKQAELGYLH